MANIESNPADQIEAGSRDIAKGKEEFSNLEARIAAVRELLPVLVTDEEKRKGEELLDSMLVEAETSGRAILSKTAERDTSIEGLKERYSALRQQVWLDLIKLRDLGDSIYTSPEKGRDEKVFNNLADGFAEAFPLGKTQ